MNILKNKLILKMLFITLWIQSCSKIENFPDLANKISSPTDVATTSDGKFFFVLNSDYDRSYASGSLLTLDENGSVLNALKLPRLGRNLQQSGNDLIITIDKGSEDEKAKVLLVDISTPSNPQIQSSFDLECSPWNSVLKENYKYFAVSCIGGGLYIGELATPRSSSTLKLVRNYGRSRRAMILDTERNLLYMFPTVTNLKRTQIADLEDSDTKTLNEETGSISDLEGGDEIPDSLQSSVAVNRRRRDSRQIWQMVVYNLGKESSISSSNCPPELLGICDPFPYRKLDYSSNAVDKTVKDELRWIYFTLTNVNGDPDTNSGFSDLSKKVYRTNFWEAKPDPIQKDAFYISQRGGPSSPYSNHIVKVVITGDPSNKNLQSKDVFEFERVYGFGGELDPNGKHYPGDFEIVNINGMQTILVNHFKDPSGFKREDTYFSIAGKILGENFWVPELSAEGAQESFFQIAVNTRGRAITGSFYGNAVILLDIVPGVGITKRQRIE